MSTKYGGALVSGSVLYGSTGGSLGTPGAQIPTVGSAGPSVIAQYVSLPADAAVEFRAVLQAAPAGTTSLVLHGDGSFTATAPDGTYSFTLDLLRDGVSQGTKAATFQFGNAQTIAATLDGITVSIIQVRPVANAQVVAATLGDVIGSVTQVARHAQTVAATLDSLSVTSAQVANHPSTLTATLADINVAIQEVAANAKGQALALTLDGVIGSVAQTLLHAQAITAALDSIAVSVAESKAAAGSNSAAISITLDPLSSAVGQTLAHPQSLAAALGGITAALTQTVAAAPKTQVVAVSLSSISVQILQTGPASNAPTLAPLGVPVYVVRPQSSRVFVVSR